MESTDVPAPAGVEPPARAAESEDVVVVSKGYHVGNMAEVVVRGVKTKLQTRGWHLVLLSEGKVAEQHSYDLYGCKDDSLGNELVAKIQHLRHDQLAILTVKDDGSRNCPRSLFEAFQSLGSAAQECCFEAFSKKRRMSFALVGRKGAPRGSALEKMSERGEVVLRTSFLRKWHAPEIA